MNTLIKNITWIFSGNIIAAITKWLTLVLIARLLIPEELGSYTLAFAITAPITLFINLKLRSLIVTDKNIIFSDYLFTRKITSIFALAIIILLGIFIYPNHLWVIILVGLNKILDLHSDLYYSIPQINNDFDYIGKLMISKHILILIFFSITLLISKNLILSLVVQFVIQYVFYYRFEKKGINSKYDITKRKIKFRSIKKIILIGIPLGLSMMLVSLTTNFPKYVLEYFESIEILGYFSAVTYILVLGNLIMNSISQNFLPKLSRLIIKNKISLFKKHVFIHMTFVSLILGALTILGTHVFGEFLLVFIYGNDYVEYVDILIIIGYALAINLIGWNFDTALMSMRSIRIQPIISSITLLTSILFSIILINFYGIYGAAYSLVITNSIQTVFRLLFLCLQINKLQKIQ